MLLAVEMAASPMSRDTIEKWDVEIKRVML
jgi:hypothetical protein